jgi:hypothetical protein
MNRTNQVRPHRSISWIPSAAAFLLVCAASAPVPASADCPTYTESYAFNEEAIVIQLPWSAQWAIMSTRLVIAPYPDDPNIVDEMNANEVVLYGFDYGPGGNVAAVTPPAGSWGRWTYNGRHAAVNNSIQWLDLAFTGAQNTAAIWGAIELPGCHLSGEWVMVYLNDLDIRWPGMPL